MSNQHILEDINYYGDPRVRAKQKGSWFHTRVSPFLVILAFEDREGAVVDREVRVTYAVCPTCEGLGHHVNPSIDCGGLTEDDFADDPDLAEGYLRGRYDVPCYECHGEKVVLVPHPEETDVIAYLDEQAELEYQSHLEQQAERRFGC